MCEKVRLRLGHDFRTRVGRDRRTKIMLSKNKLQDIFVVLQIFKYGKQGLQKEKVSATENKQSD